MLYVPISHVKFYLKFLCDYSITFQLFELLYSTIGPITVKFLMSLLLILISLYIILDYVYTIPDQCENGEKNLKNGIAFTPHRAHLFENVTFTVGVATRPRFLINVIERKQTERYAALCIYKRRFFVLVV